MCFPLIIITALLTIDNNVHGARILGIFPHVGRSHQMVFEPYLQKLAERGHQVTVLSFFPRKMAIENYTDVSLEGLAPIAVESLPVTLFERESFIRKVGLGAIEKFIAQLMEFEDRLGTSALTVCSQLVGYPPLEAALKKKYDLVIVESFNSDCVFGILHVFKVKAPIIALSTCVFMPWSSDRMGLPENPSYIPVRSSTISDNMNYMQRVYNTFLSVFYKQWYRYMVQKKEQALIEKRYGKTPDLQDLGNKISLMLVNTFHSLNGVRPTLPGVVEVGGIHLTKKTYVLPQFIDKFLNESEHGVVLVSFGSLLKTSTMSKRKEEIMIRVFSKLKQRVIWKFESSDEKGTRVGYNILRIKWIPQYQILQHKKVVAFVAHGGLLGMTEAIAAGKPMLVMPFLGDQPLNALRAKEVGLGTILSFNDMTDKTFHEALQNVLSDEMRNKARQASEIWLDRPAPPMDTAIYWTERVIKWGEHAPLHSIARELNGFQILLLDVIAGFILILIVICFIIIVILRFVFLVSNHVLFICLIFNSKKEKVR